MRQLGPPCSCADSPTPQAAPGSHPRATPSSSAVPVWSSRKVASLKPESPCFPELSATQPGGNGRGCRRVGSPGCRQLTEETQKAPEVSRRLLVSHKIISITVHLA